MSQVISIRRVAAAILATAILCAGELAPNTVRAEGLCYTGGGLGAGRVAADGWGASKGKAQQRARRNWSEAASRAMGTSRAGNWGNSINRSYYCHRGFGWDCTAFATPCA